VLGMVAVCACFKDLVGDHDIAGAQSQRERARDTGADHELGIRKSRKRATRGLARPPRPHPSCHERDFAPARGHAKAAKPLLAEGGPLPEAPLQRPDFARKRVENENQVDALWLRRVPRAKAALERRAPC
jgi:hypothetical protein